jgi:hypothetical protein
MLVSEEGVSLMIVSTWMSLTVRPFILHTASVYHTLIGKGLGLLTLTVAATKTFFKSVPTGFTDCRVTPFISTG